MKYYKKYAISSAMPSQINIEINFNVNKTYAIGLWLPFNVHIIQKKGVVLQEEEI